MMRHDANQRQFSHMEWSRRYLIGRVLLLLLAVEFYSEIKKPPSRCNESTSMRHSAPRLVIRRIKTVSRNISD